MPTFDTLHLDAALERARNSFLAFPSSADPLALGRHIPELTLWQDRLAREVGVIAQMERVRLPIAQMHDDMRSARQALFPTAFELQQLSIAAESYRVLRSQLLFAPNVDYLEQARKAAELAHAVALPAVLETFRTTQESMALKLALVQNVDWLNIRQNLGMFTHVSALSDMLAASTYVARDLNEAIKAVTLAGMPGFATLSDHRRFLDAAGLLLPRWPRVRLLSAAERRRQLKSRLRENAEPRHVRKAKSLVHRYELLLRDILDMAMASAFGDDWAERRLPLCECKDLLGKWRKRGGDVLDHADYAHYARIMSHREHFESVFAVAFEDRDELHGLLVKAGQLRAASHHAQPFTADDLRDLRITWLTIEAGLVALTPAYTVDG